MDVADTATIKRASTILPERYQVNVLRSRLPSFDALFMLAPLLSRLRSRLSVRYLRLAHVGNKSDRQMRIVDAIRIRVRFPELLSSGARCSTQYPAPLFDEPISYLAQIMGETG